MSASTGAIRPHPDPLPGGEGDTGGTGRFLLGAYTLWRRELVRFYRQRSRLIGTVASPLVFWLLIGSGLGQMEYLFPGTVVLTVLFTAVFSTISIIEDRREGFLQSVLVAPVPRSAVAIGKIVGGATLAMVPAVVFMLLGPAAGIVPTPAGAAASVLVLFFVALALTGLGFLIAWNMDSTQGFHAIMNLFLIPLWLLSGAIFPATASTPAWLRWVVTVNPLSYGIAAFRRCLYLGTENAAAPPGTGPGLPALGPALAVTAVFGAALLLLATAVARRQRRGAHA